MKIEVGKEYATRDGRRAVISYDPDGQSREFGGFIILNAGLRTVCHWDVQGNSLPLSPSDEPSDLVAEWGSHNHQAAAHVNATAPQSPPPTSPTGTHDFRPVCASAVQCVHCGFVVDAKDYLSGNFPSPPCNPVGSTGPGHIPNVGSSGAMGALPPGSIVVGPTGGGGAGGGAGGALTGKRANKHPWAVDGHRMQHSLIGNGRIECACGFVVTPKDATARGIFDMYEAVDFYNGVHCPNFSAGVDPVVGDGPMPIRGPKPCTCPMHGPEGLLARGCQCGAALADKINVALASRRERD